MAYFYNLSDGKQKFFLSCMAKIDLEEAMQASKNLGEEVTENSDWHLEELPEDKFWQSFEKNNKYAKRQNK